MRPLHDVLGLGFSILHIRLYHSSDLLCVSPPLFPLFELFFRFLLPCSERRVTCFFLVIGRRQYWWFLAVCSTWGGRRSCGACSDYRCFNVAQAGRSSKVGSHCTGPVHEPLCSVANVIGRLYSRPCSFPIELFGCFSRTGLWP